MRWSPMRFRGDCLVRESSHVYPSGRLERDRKRHSAHHRGKCGDVTITHAPARRSSCGNRSRDLARLKEVFRRRLVLTEWWSLQILSEEASHLIVLRPRGADPVHLWIAIESGKLAIDAGPFRALPSWLGRDLKEFLLELGLPMNLRVFDVVVPATPSGG